MKYSIIKVSKCTSQKEHITEVGGNVYSLCQSLYASEDINKLFNEAGRINNDYKCGCRVEVKEAI